MSRSIRQPHRLHWGVLSIAVGIFLAGILASLSCQDDSLVPPFCPPYRVGALEGYVTMGGEPVLATVGARMITSPGIVVSKTRTDSTGWYRLDLAFDTYRIEINPSSGGYTSTPLRDTVQVGPGRRRFDLRHGVLTVRLATPSEMDGRTFSCGLEPLVDDVSRGSVRAAAQDGRLEFRFPMLDPGIFRVGLGGDSYREIWLPGTYELARADKVMVPSDRPALYEATLDLYASISGTVRGSWQEAQVATPWVTAYSPESNSIARRSVAQDGSYTLDLFVARPVKLEVEITNVEQWIGGDSFETATLFAPQPGDHLQNISLVESGIDVRLEGPGLFIAHRGGAVIRDAAGPIYSLPAFYANHFTICNLRPGRLFLFLHGYCESGQPWGSTWYDGADSLAAATPIDVPEGRLVPITMHLPAGATIEARVLSAAGQIVPGTSVGLFDRHGQPLCENEWQYSASGTFSFQALGNGEYCLAARTDAGLWWYPGTAEVAGAAVIEIRDHTSVTGIEWRLPGPAAGGRP